MPADIGGKRGVWTVAELPRRRDTSFDLTLNNAERERLAHELEIDGIRKLRFAGALRAEGERDWRLEAQLSATVVQACVVTLVPVTTRLEETVTRRFLADFPEDAAPGSETEFAGDESDEALGREIDLMAVLREALALAVPSYPRVEGAEAHDTIFAGPGVAPMSDEDARPFAGLAGLKAKLDPKD